MTTETVDLKQMCKYIRKSIINMITDAQCGHTGGSLSEVEILVALYFKHMNIDVANPSMIDRDRFVLSKGHSTPGYYCVLAKRGYFAEEELKGFDKLDSILQGHPSMTTTPGVDMSTGSLGQGLSIGIGMALGGKQKGLDYKVYVVVGDGEMQEGQNWEAIMYAGANKVKNLIGIIDYNKVQLTGTNDEILSLAPLDEKMKAFHWQVVNCKDGNDIDQMDAAIAKAKKLSEQGPVMIIAHTIKGKGVSFAEGKYQWHGKAPNEQERKQALEEIENAG